MPIYEYRCSNGHTFEVFQSMSDDPVTTCEVCDAKVERVLSAPAIHFKGSGFYTTDYAKKGAAKPAGDGSASKSDSSDSASKSDSSKSDSSKGSSNSGSAASSSSNSGSGSGEKAKSKSSSD
jgi:putative FmdB family regulatory protein